MLKNRAPPTGSTFPVKPPLSRRGLGWETGEGPGVRFRSGGIPAVMVTDTADVRNPQYHSRFDTAATLDYARMARVVDGVTNAVLALSGGTGAHGTAAAAP